MQAPRDFVTLYLFNGISEETWKKNLEKRVELRLFRIEEIVGLEEAQRTKLELALKGDLCRFYRSMALAREQTKGLDMRNQNDVQKGWQIIMPLQQQAAKGVIDENSLFEKVLSIILTEKQRGQYDDYSRKRQRTQVNAFINMTIVEIEKSLPLSAHQRQALVKIIQEKPLPALIPANATPYVGYAMLSRVTAADLQDLLDESQQKVFLQIQQQYAGQARAIKW
jgi:hypothetical protein